jgi:hypothetical protein
MSTTIISRSKYSIQHSLQPLNRNFTISHIADTFSSVVLIIIHVNWHHVSYAISVDDMGTRIDELERSIGDLMEQAGIDTEVPEGESTKWAVAAYIEEQHL